MSGEGLYRRRALRRLKFGERVLLSAGDDCEAVGWALADALSGCDDFRTLAEHAAEAWRRAYGKARHLEAACREAAPRLGLDDPGHGVHAVELALRALARRGFLVERRGLLPDARVAEEAPPPPLLAVLGIGEPEALRRALEALRAAQPLLPAGSRLVALDCGDGREPARRAAAAAASVPFVGRRERAALARALVSRGAPGGAAQAALLGFHGVDAGAAAAYNAALLLAAGARLLVLDDAAALAGGAAPEARAGLALAAGVGSRRWLFGAAARRALTPADAAGLLRPILETLGRPARSLARAADESGTLELSEMGEAWPDLLGRGVVRLVHAGAAGAGLSDGASALRLGAAAQRGLFEDGAALACALGGGFAAGFAPRLTLQERLWCRLHAFGVDLRRAPPPFLPTRLGARGLFCRLLGRMQRDTVAAEVPWLAAFTASGEPAGPEATLAQLVGELVDAGRAPLGSLEPAAALRAGADAVRGLAELPDEEWRRWARNVRWNSLRTALDSAAALAREERAPAPWLAAARARVERLRAALVDPHVVTPREALPAASPEEGAARGRRLVLETAALMEGWPALWEAALSGDRGELLPA